MRILLNVLAFQVGWFASVLGAAHSNPWLGPLTVAMVPALHVYQTSRRWGELILALVAGAFGFIDKKDSHDEGSRRDGQSTYPFTVSEVPSTRGRTKTGASPRRIL